MSGIAVILWNIRDVPRNMGGVCICTVSGVLRPGEWCNSDACHRIKVLGHHQNRRNCASLMPFCATYLFHSASAGRFSVSQTRACLGDCIGKAAFGFVGLEAFSSCCVTHAPRRPRYLLRKMLRMQAYSTPAARNAAIRSGE